MKIKANCKINLGLDVLRRREDGYHDLSTIMLPVAGLHDIVEIEKRNDEKVVFHGKGMQVDCADDDNICVKAAKLMQQMYGVAGVDITLDKRVPFGAGLGLTLARPYVRGRPNFGGSLLASRYWRM